MNKIAATLDIRRVTALHDEVAEAGVLVSALAALLIGAAPAIVNFFFHAGQGVH